MKSLIEKWRNLPRIAYIFGLANFVIAVGAFVMPFLTFMLTSKLGMSTLEAAFYVNIVFFAHVPAQILGGWLTDKFGRKPIYVAAISAEIILTAIAGFFAEQFILIYFLFAIAFMNGIVAPVIHAWQSDYSTAKNRQMVFATSYFGWNLGFAIGPAIAGLLFNDYFQFMFWGDALTTTFGVLIVLFLLPSKKPEQDKDDEIDVPKAEQNYEGSIWSLFFSRPRLLLFAIVGYFLNMIYGQMTFTVPLHLSAVFGESGASVFGQLWSFNAFMVLVLTPIAVGYLSRFSTYTNIAIIGVCYGIGFWLFGSTISIWILLVSIVIFSLGEVTFAANMQTHIANESPKNFRGRVSGSINLIIGAGYGMSPLISGLFIERWGIEAIWPTLFVVSILCSVAILFLRPKTSVPESIA
ncbi:MFS transporter [Maritalea sp.]|uniref:MFS transporter n=1 Tax=Maritalea sp. TaxID=2003361 RepID=UPI003EF3A29C